MPFQFDRIEQRSLYTEIMQRIRHAIVFGEVGLGEYLSKPSIARQMEVSRIPLREALVHLTKVGIVDHIQSRGFFVISFSPQDIREVFSMRSMLECMALARSFPFLVAEDFNQLECLVEQQKKAIVTFQYDLLTQLDMRFHEYFYTKANHERLLKTWRNYEMQCQMLINHRFRTYSIGTPGTVIADHEQLLEAAHQQDISLAIEITRSINNRVAEECIQMAQERSSKGGELFIKISK